LEAMTSLEPIAGEIVEVYKPVATLEQEMLGPSSPQVQSRPVDTLPFTH
jgi:hypothetical protein